MPICTICDTRYYPATFSAPGEGCDCNHCYAADYVETDADAEEVAELRRQWKAGKGTTPATEDAPQPGGMS